MREATVRSVSVQMPMSASPPDSMEAISVGLPWCSMRCTLG